jgi:single-strand DNA-binding protein
MSINTVTIVGNLTRDPDLRTTGSGMSVCALRIAVNSRQKDANGEWGERPNYFDVTVFGTQGENASTHLAKGRQVGVTGRLEWREWEDKEGGKRQAVSIVATEVQFLGSKADAPAREPEPAPVTEDTPAEDLF